MLFPSLLLVLSLTAAAVNASVTVYTTSTTALGPAPTYNAASIDQTVLQPPGAPTGQDGTVAVQLYDGGMNGMSSPVGGGFMGFSIELSVATTLLGQSGGVLNPEFLNYCALIEQRGGSVTIRVGGNTQDTAILNTSGQNKTIMKSKANYSSTTDTPDVEFTADLFYAMQAITKLVNANWFFGLPFISLDADGNAGEVYTQVQSALGSNLLGFQMANEPDLYFENGKKGPDYSIPNFMSDYATMIQRVPINQEIIAGPSVCCKWNVSDVFNAGFLTQFNPQIKYIDTMHYPNDNCSPGAQEPQDIIGGWLSHSSVIGNIQQFDFMVTMAQQANKQIMMMETNTASCGGFQGISNAFVSTLWSVDYSLQMAANNFTYALYHFGGQNVYYNPFTPPPTNMSKYYQWTTGAIFYGHLVVAEAIGKSGNARVVDLLLDNNNDNRAGYAVYEQGTASRVVLVNYVGGSPYNAVIAVGGQSTGLPSVTPASVQVKYLVADSVTELYNITWAGQTMGTVHESDGRLYGTLNVTTIQCDTQAGTCTIPVPSPGVAVVFMTEAAYANSGGEISTELTFATTTTTGKHATKATYNLAALATSNGRNGSVPLGGTSKSTPQGSWAARAAVVGWGAAVGGVLVLALGLLVNP